MTRDPSDFLAEPDLKDDDSIDEDADAEALRVQWLDGQRRYPDRRPGA